MAVVHLNVMTMARRLAQADTLQRQDAHERALNKLARTFSAQVEALRRYRGGGEQRMIVEHVNVGEGGQAIIGNVNSTGGRENMTDNPMQRARRCHARSKRTGLPCKAPAVRGYSVCRMHGAGGGAPVGNKNALKHGGRSAEIVAARRAANELCGTARETIASLTEAAKDGRFEVD